MKGRNITTRFFKDFFPPPQYLRFPSVGVDISNQSLRIIELVRRHGRTEIGKWGEHKIPAGIIYRDAITDESELKTTLEEVKKKYNLKFIHVSLPEDKAYVFNTTIARIPVKEIRGSLELQLEENVPLRPDEVEFDFTIIGEDTAHDSLRLGVAVFPKVFIDRITALLESVGLTALSYRVSADAIAAAVTSKTDLSANMIVNFGEERTGIYIAIKGAAVFSSTLNFGAAALLSGIQKHFGVTHEEALKIRRGANNPYNKSSMQLFYSVINPISALKDEINRILLYWKTHKDKQGSISAPVSSIILCGSNSNMPAMDEYLSLSLKLPTHSAEVWKNALDLDDYIPPITHAQSLDYAAAVGLALGEETLL